MDINPVAAEGFGAGAAAYERGRPSYPDEAVRLLVDDLGIGPGRRVLDLAAGTGKLTRLLATMGAELVAVEPVAAMRETFVALLPGVEVHDATAESLPFPDGSIDVVTVAQAFHWFRPEDALAEIARVLRPGGWLGLIWNERDDSVPWVAELGELFDWRRERPYDKDRDWASVIVEASSRFGTVQHDRLAHTQELDADTLVDRVLSTSYVARWPQERQEQLARDVRRLVSGFPTPFTLPYVTDVYRCHRT